MKEFHDYIVAFINANTDLKAVNLYRGQDDSLAKREEEYIFYPAVFIEYQIVETRNLALKVKDYVLNVVFRFMFEDYTVNRLEDITEVDNFIATMQGLRAVDGENIVQFTGFEEVGRSFDFDHDMVNMPFVTFKTVLRNTKAFDTLTEKTPVTIKTNGEIS